MISAKRILMIFRQRGGDEFANPAEQLMPEQLADLETAAEGKPIIAKVSSKNEWLVLTESHLVLKYRGEMRRVPFDDIYNIEVPKAGVLNPRIKADGGDLDVGLRDGSAFRIRVEPAGPYFGLMNVLMRIAKINRRQRQEISLGSETVPPTTSGERPTTAL
jgi:hypothetical protein